MCASFGVVFGLKILGLGYTFIGNFLGLGCTVLLKILVMGVECMGLFESNTCSVLGENVVQLFLYRRHVFKNLVPMALPTWDWDRTF